MAQLGLQAHICTTRLYQVRFVYINCCARMASEKLLQKGNLPPGDPLPSMGCPPQANHPTNAEEAIAVIVALPKTSVTRCVLTSRRHAHLGLVT